MQRPHSSAATTWLSWPWLDWRASRWGPGEVDDDVADYFDEKALLATSSDGVLWVVGSPVTHFAGTAIGYVLSAGTRMT